MIPQNAFRFLALFSVLLLSACSGPFGDAPPGAEKSLKPREQAAAVDVAVDTRGLPPVSRMLAARGPSAVLRDEPATETYRALSELFARGEQHSLRLGVYRLTPVSASSDVLSRRAEELGLARAAEVASPEKHLLLMRDGDRELRLNRQSGAEFFVDRALFHKGRGEPFAREDVFYVEAARAHVEHRVSPESTTLALVPYKIRRYLNKSAAYGDAEPRSEVYQVAVHFNTLIDDLPVIGPGGKVSVHLTVDGRVVSHESSVRPIASRQAVVGGDAILPPEVARKRVEDRLRSLGIAPERFTLAREEFGYLRLGRSSVQGLLVPHYAFIYEPRAGETAKRLVETLPAVTDPKVLAALEDDLTREHARKEEMKRFAAATPDRRK